MPPSAGFALPTEDPDVLLPLLETLELNHATRNLPHPEPAAHLLTLLILSDLPEARFLWRRLPPTLKEDPPTRAAWSLATALSTRNTDIFYSSVSFPWPTALVPLVQLLVRCTRNEMVLDLKRSYETVALSRVKVLLGMNQDGVQLIAQEEGWEIVDGYVHMSTTSAEHRPEKAAVELQTLTEQLVRLQTSA